MSDKMSPEELLQTKTNMAGILLTAFTGTKPVHPYYMQSHNGKPAEQGINTQIPGTEEELPWKVEKKEIDLTAAYPTEEEQTRSFSEVINGETYEATITYPTYGKHDHLLSVAFTDASGNTSRACGFLNNHSVSTTINRPATGPGNLATAKLFEPLNIENLFELKDW